MIREECELGDRVILHPGVAIGADGFGYAFDEAGRPAKIPQVGRVVIEDDVEIGALAAVDRATLGVTRIGQNAKIDDLCIIAHNCEIGPDVIIVGLSGLAGSTVVGRGAILMGQTATTGHLRIGERAFLGGRAAVHKDVPAGVHVWGAPAMEQRAWHKSMAALARLPEALRRLRAVERMVGTAHPAAARTTRERASQRDLALSVLQARARDARDPRAIAALLRALRGDERAGAVSLADLLARRLAERAARAAAGGTLVRAAPSPRARRTRCSWRASTRWAWVRSRARWWLPR